MGIVLKNNAKTTLAAEISSLDTTIYVASTDSFPSLSPGEWFYVTIESAHGAYEIVKVTQTNNTSFIVERAQEDTIAIPFIAGARVELRVTIQSINDQFADVTQGPQGETGPQGPQGIQGIQGPAGAGDVTGPATHAANSFARWDSTPDSKTLIERSASEMRTDLGLGTSATVNTGTSGAVIPLLNGDNTWSGRQEIRVNGATAAHTYGDDLVVGNETAQSGITLFSGNNSVGYFFFGDADSSTVGRIMYNHGSNTLSLGAGGTTAVLNVTSSAANISGNAILTTADLGSTVQAYDADTAKLDVTNIWTNTQRYSSAQPRIDYEETDGPSNEKVWTQRFNSGNAVRSASNDAFASEVIFELIQRTGTTIDEIEWNATAFDFNGTMDVSGGITVGANAVLTAATGAQLGSSNSFTANQTIDVAGTGPHLLVQGGASGTVLARFQRDNASTGIIDIISSGGNPQIMFDRGSDGVNFSVGVSATGLEVATTAVGTGTIATFFAAGGLQADVPVSSETSGTLTATSANKEIRATGSITIPASVFASPNKIKIYAGSSSRTLTQGSGLTMRLAGTTTTGSLTIAVRGYALVEFISDTECVVSGDVS